MTLKQDVKRKVSFLGEKVVKGFPRKTALVVEKGKSVPDTIPER